ncbi:MAG: S-layer homology domain-containing protein, partial [Clostridiales bacterium]|nr:S-layer homology domain-containing protein [Clostridiales bacterium]
SLTYNTDLYSSASASFPSGSIATVGGDPVSMTVTYQKKGETAFNTTQYTVSVVRAAGTAPVFFGTLNKTIVLANTYTFKASDFENLYTKNDGGALESIQIIGNNPAFGTLKLNNENYVSGNSITVADLENGKLSFVPISEGTASYEVKATVSGASNALEGSVTLTITVKNIGDGTISYETKKETAIAFNSADFANAFENATGKTLSYVQFTLPSSLYGKLYYNYTSHTNYESIVTADTKYYRSILPDLSRVTFLPKSDFIGKVTITYKGYDTEGFEFIGKIIVTVVNQNSNSDVILYQSLKDTPISFKVSDFNKESEEVTGAALSSVKFTLPDSSKGILYYDYKSSSDHTAVLADTNYYKEKFPNLSKVDFVPASGYTGDVTISYTGYNINGGSFTGTIKITVTENKSGSKYFKDVNKNTVWAAEAIDYLYEHNIITASKNGKFHPNASIKRGDFILMLCRAFDLKADARGNFTDVSENSYYYHSIGVFKKLGICKGSKGRFNPNAALSRQDAMVLLLRAMEAANISINTSADGNLSSYSDANQISDYATDAVKKLTKANIVRGCNKKLSPKSSVSRAEMAVILYRILTK